MNREGFRVRKVVLEAEVVGPFLRDRFADVGDVALITGGAWSAAYQFTGDGQHLVVKFGQYVEDYLRDAHAGSWNLPHAPAPTVFELGVAFDGCFSIAEFVDGDAFDELTPDRFATAQASLLRAYEGIASVEAPGSGFGIWTGPTGAAPHPTWSAFLTSVPERDDERLSGWRERLAHQYESQVVFDAAQHVIERLAPSCPNERSFNHCDPLWGNILINTEGQIAALLDWGTSVIGDSLYDLAMLMFCEPWCAGINVETLHREADRRAGKSSVHERLHASLLHIGMEAMQYQAFANLQTDLAITTRVVNEITMRDTNTYRL